MNARGGIALIGLLLLSGCATPAPEVADTPAPAAPTAEAPTGPTTISEVETLEDGIAYARTIEEDSTKIAELAQKLPDLVVAADIPSTLNNEINQDLISLNFDCLSNPENGAAQRVELWRITALIKGAI